MNMIGYQRLVWTTVLLSLIVGTESCGRSRCRGGRPPDTTKPTVKCPRNIVVVADDKKTSSSQVRWTVPSGNDNRDGSVTANRRGLGSGQKFPEGTKEVEYIVKDRSGNHNTCKFTVTVQVHRCQRWGTQVNGWMQCDPSHDMLKGTVCRFGCHPGFTLVGQESVKCVYNNKWEVRNQPYCQPITCPRLTEPNDKTSISCSFDNKYQSACQYACVDSYDILPGHNRVRVCSADDTWTGSEPSCEDVTPPDFTSCPAGIVGYAESSKTSGRLSWNTPMFTDNDGLGGVTLVQTQGPPSGTELDVGDYRVTYTATDKANNTATCTFKAVIKQITCHTLFPLPYTRVACPGGRKYGSECMFSCPQNSTALNGQGNVQCHSISHGQVRYGQWSFGRSQPYCEFVALCTKPNPPDNGALACDTWAGGKYCQVQCQAGYLIPQKLDQPLLCTDSGGTWRQLGDEQTVPDCTESTPFLELFYKLKEYFYYSGDCDSAKDEISTNYIVALETSLGNVCQSTKCTAELVHITCGNSTSSRRKRSLDSNVELLVEIKIDNVGTGTLDANDAVVIKQGIMTSRSENAEQTMVGGVVLESRGVHVSEPQGACPSGYYINKYTLRCVACGQGTYYENGSGECTQCPRGQYQSQLAQTTCLQCPLHKTTEHPGAVSQDQCIDGCPPGHYSSTGTAPCTPCDTGTYTGTYGTTVCTRCPGSKTTSPTTVATGTSDCFDFDIDFPGLTDAQPATVSMELQNDVTSFYASFWTLCSQCNNIVSMVNADGNEVLAMSQSEYLTIDLNGCSLETTYNLTGDTPRWHHVVLNVTSHVISLSVDGLEEYRGTDCLQQTVLEASLYNVTVGGEGFVGHISQVNVWTEYVDATLATSTCFSDVTGDMLSWQQFQDSEGSFVISASECDDFNNCENEPCLNNGVCTDGQGTFTCSCQRGFTGDTCNTNINDCVENSCQNSATCQDIVNGYTCLCDKHHTGSFCEILIVDGGWTPWSPWGPCSVTCDSGVHTRTRNCSDPVPAHGGAYCSGPDQETGDCGMPDACYNECGEDPAVVENGHLNCSWNDVTNTTRVCNPYCDDGYDFDSDLFLAEIVCGPHTAYTWNVRNEDNPDAQLPTCTAKSMAKDNVMVYRGEYNDLTDNVTEGSQAVAKDTISERVNHLTGMLDCVKDGQCSVASIDVTEPGYDDNDADTGSRRKRATPYLGFIIRITCSPKTDIKECYDLLVDAYNALQTLVNQTMFSIEFNNVVYDVLMGQTSVNGTVTCGPGTVQIDYYCVVCGPGTYKHIDYCERCPRGTYQNEAGQDHCKRCPDGWTTSGLHTKRVSQCDVKVPSYPTADNGDFPLWLIGLLTVCVIGLVLLCTGCIYRLNRRPAKVKPQQSNRRHQPLNRNYGDDTDIWDDPVEGYKVHDIQLAPLSTGLPHNYTARPCVANTRFVSSRLGDRPATPRKSDIPTTESLPNTVPFDDPKPAIPTHSMSNAVPFVDPPPPYSFQ